MKVLLALSLLSSFALAEMQVVLIPEDSLQVESVTGDILNWSDESFTLQSQEISRGIPTNNARSIRFPQRSSSPENDQGPIIVTFTNDDQLRVQSVTLEHEIVKLALPDDMLMNEKTSVPIGLEYIRSIQFQSGTLPSASHQNDDIIVLSNGNLIRGQINKIGSDQIAATTQLGDILIDPKQLLSISLNPELAEVIPPPEAYALMYFHDESILSVTKLQLGSATSLSAITSTGETLSVNPFLVQRIDFYNERFVSLMNFPIEESINTTFFDTTFKPVKNRNLHGDLMRCGNETFRRGWGVSSRSALKFKCPPHTRGLYVHAGLDDSTNAKGHAIASITVDTASQFEKVISGKGIVHAILVDLSNAKSVSLNVDFGAGADIQDVTNWCDPVFIMNTQKR